jgi:hypothetical protein
MAQPNMNKKLFPIQIAFKKVTLIIEICGGGFVHIICATCQLESKKQNQYPIKEFLFVHLHYPFHFDLILILDSWDSRLCRIRWRSHGSS